MSSDAAAKELHTGACLCGAVRYQVRGPLRPVIACHCGQCRKTSGHFVAATGAPRDRITVEASDALSWYRSSEVARRGFCRICGSSLFWQHDEADYTAIMAGVLDGPTGLTTVEHIHVADKGDYYAIADDLPQHDHGSGRIPAPAEGSS